MMDTAKDELASDIRHAWRRYTDLFGEPPHGTLPQIKALVALMPTKTADSPVLEHSEIRSES